MPQKDRISVLGDGGWGTTLALLLAGKGYRVTLWGAFPKYVDEVRRKRENVKFLPGFRIPAGVRLESDLAAACRGADLIVLAVPSQFLRGVVRRMKAEGAGGAPLVIVAKGIETGSLKVMSQVVRDELGNVSVCVLSGPTIARDVARKLPAAVSVASSNRALAAKVRKIFSTDYFSLFESDDVLGVELGGSVKNVLAIASGILEGLGYGSNTRAILFARGVAEMARLGRKMGARRETFMGLSGLGDLATTCLSPSSRNRSLGEAIGKGKKLKALLAGTEMVVEGVDTAKAAAKLAKKLNVKMPITEAVNGVLFEGKKPDTILKALLNCGHHRELD
ncbi:MAG TPA: NAD(P)H-dependent glycerol-3-phosphate dehydrogenase [Candidatus Eisenbacteria bacterium]|nr:NAD(P)H-dependent glycerol-3-phosphate dehydrogenase [Candidatus Eisenbacteria bacterium]